MTELTEEEAVEFEVLAKRWAQRGGLRAADLMRAIGVLKALRVNQAHHQRLSKKRV